MGWLEAKAKLATVLGSVTIELPGADPEDQDPPTQQIHHAYPSPPPSIEPGMLPCVLLGDAPFDDEWDSELAIEDYDVECFLLLRHEDSAIATQLVERYRQAFKEALRANVKLGLSAVRLFGASYEQLTSIDYAGSTYAGFRFRVQMAVNDEAPGFAPGS